ncbi:aminoglycoside phosphotransferase family protein [Paracoccaceae bacterium]|nr:aminoglycoside phosphotransferase family protein [Paracoccaceae bacterium]
MSEFLQIKLENASLDEIAGLALKAIGPNASPKKTVDVKDVSGNSGAKTYICSIVDGPKCIVKVSSSKSIMSSHPITQKRVSLATEVLRSQNLAPPIILKGIDFHIERSSGISVMQDFFHFNEELAPPDKVAQVLAKLHSAPTNWFDQLKAEFLAGDKFLSSTLNSASPNTPFWCLPWSGIDTKMPVLGVGNPDPKIAKKVFELGVKTGVYEKVIQCEAFSPISEAAKRQVVVHNDFKPDNILYDPDTEELTVIDYDLVQVGAAVMDFGLPYMMWLGSRFTDFSYRRDFIKSYLHFSSLPTDEKSVRAMMVDCEINTIVAFPGLLANIYDAEIPLLRGVDHPTAKSGYIAQSSEASPTGLEIVDLLSEAVSKVKSNVDLITSSLEEGLVVTIFKNKGLGSDSLFSWLKEMQKNNMLRLFGIAETDGAELFVSDHAKKKK